MKAQTEAALRNIAGLDPEVKAENLERALRFLRGERDENGPLVEVMKRKEVMELLKIHRRTLDYYIEKGYLDRVYGGGERAIGISRDSFIRFTTRRMLKKEGLA